MSSSGPRAKLLLLKDFEAGAGAALGIDDLQRRLRALPGFADVELQPNGRSTVFASVPARNQRDCDRLKALVNDKVDGWRVIEEQSYQLPTTF